MAHRRSVAFVFTALVASAGLAGTAWAAAATVTLHDTFSDSHPDSNPCTGGLGTFSQSGTTVLHDTQTAGGEAFTETIVGTFAFAGNNPLDSVSGRFTGWFGGTFNARGVSQDGGTFSVTAADKAGHHIVMTEVTHETIGADGIPRVQFDRPQLHCTG